MKKSLQITVLLMLKIEESLQITVLLMLKIEESLQITVPLMLKIEEPLQITVLLMLKIVCRYLNKYFESSICHLHTNDLQKIAVSSVIGKKQLIDFFPFNTVITRKL